LETVLNVQEELTQLRDRMNTLRSTIYSYENISRDCAKLLIIINNIENNVHVIIIIIMIIYRVNPRKTSSRRRWTVRRKHERIRPGRGEADVSRYKTSRYGNDCGQRRIYSHTNVSEAHFGRLFPTERLD